MKKNISHVIAGHEMLSLNITSNFHSNKSISSKEQKVKLEESNEKPFLEHDGYPVKRFSPFCRQVLAVSGPIVATVCAGTTSGFSAILLPQLRDTDSPIQITEEQDSWIASMAVLPMSLGCILGGILMERFGRKKTHLFLCAPYLLGWSVITFATSVEMILTGRFLSGLCSGLLSPPSVVYVGEVSEPKYRGILLAAVTLAIAVGLSISHLLGTFLTWQVTSLICSCLPLGYTILMSLAPESPFWLAKKGYIEKAEEAFYWCRGYSMVAKEELRRLLEKQSLASQTNISVQKVMYSLKQPQFYKPLIILNLYFIANQFSGVNAIAFYSVRIMKNAVGDGLNEYMAMAIIDTIRLIMSVIACVLMRKFGRRSLSILSGFGSAFSLLSLSLFLYISRVYEEYARYSFIPLAALAGYIAFNSVGFMPIPWMLNGEFFPVEFRGFCSGTTASVAFLSFFIVVKTNHTLVKYLDYYGTFLVYGAVAFAGTIFLYFYLPETKNKTLGDIEEYFKGSGRKAVNAESIH